MLLHAIHADAHFGDMNVKGRIIIKSPDTAVLLLCIHFFPSRCYYRGLGVTPYYKIAKEV
jgi:hypothetical protein